MAEDHSQERLDTEAASAAAAAFQDANFPISRSWYQPDPLHLPYRELPNVASHKHAALFFPSAVPSTMEQVSFVTGVRTILEELGDDITADALLEQLREDFPPSRVLHPTVLQDGNYHKKLPLLMETTGITVVAHPPGKKRLIPHRNAYTLYTGDEYAEERDIANALLASYRTYNPVTGSHAIPSASAPPLAPLHSGGLPLHTPVRSSAPTPIPRPTHHYKEMVYAFKDRSTKYGGELDQNWADSIQQFDTTADIAELIPADKLRCLPLLLRDDALAYFAAHVKPIAQDYDHACQLLSHRFHGRSRQMRIKAKLLSLNLHLFHDNGQALDVTLTKLSSFIQKNFPLVPSTYQCEDNKIDILMKAVRLQPWADTAIQSLENTAVSYEGFLSKLSYGLQTYLDTQKRRGIDTPSLVDDSPSIHYQHAHSRYGHSPPSPRRPFSRLDSDRQCWNCGQSHCRLSRCRQPLDPKRIAAVVQYTVSSAPFT